jgi:hypothetical protein
MTCPDGYTYNAETKLCDLYCANGYIDPLTKICINCVDFYTTNPQTAYLISSNMTQYSLNYTRNKTNNQKLKDCIQPTPYYDHVSKSCVQCPKDYPYYNLDTDKCQNCGSGVYNPTLFNC